MNSSPLPEELRVPAAALGTAQRLWEEAGRPPHVVVDFTGVNWIDSDHLGMLVRLNLLLQRGGGRLRFRGLSAELRQVFGVTRLNQMFDFNDGEDG